MHIDRDKWGQAAPEVAQIRLDLVATPSRLAEVASCHTNLSGYADAVTNATTLGRK
jgi:hypothetical protein